MSGTGFDKRARARELAAEFASRGDALGWFDALYREAAGNIEKIPWADLEPNRFFKAWAESSGLRGDGRKALVVGCGLGDEAVYLDDLGFEVTAFDISTTAIEWARLLNEERDIKFEVVDLFEPPDSWVYGSPTADGDAAGTAGGTDNGGGFDFVLEVYTIQPLPLGIRPKVIDAIAAFVGEKGTLLVVTRGREDDEEPAELPWPVSRRDLSRFEKNGLTQTTFSILPSDEEDEPDRFIAEYTRNRSDRRRQLSRTLPRPGTAERCPN